MVDVTVKVHDKYQLEIKLNHQFEENWKVTSYKIDFLLFFPNSLGINYATYKKEDFYADIQNYIRFKTPVYLLEQITLGEKAPCTKLEKACRRLVETSNEQNAAGYEYHVKMFSAIVKSSLRDYTSFITAKSNYDEIVGLIDKYRAAVLNIADTYRSLKSVINVPTIPQGVFAVFLYGDEYLSMLIEKYTFKLLVFLDSLHLSRKENIRQALLSLIKQEIDYRKQSGYESIPMDNSDNESLIFRFSVLKKYLESVLFVEATKKPEGQLIQQLLISLAAGFAMLFATGIAFWGHYVFGNYSAPIFIILVISYMFKDRIKEISRIFLTSKILNRLYDHKIKIFIDTKKIGLLRESFHFLKRKNISQAVLKIRNIGRSKEFDNKFSKENIIHYGKFL